MRNLPDARRREGWYRPRSPAPALVDDLPQPFPLRRDAGLKPFTVIGRTPQTEALPLFTIVDRTPESFLDQFPERVRLARRHPLRLVQQRVGDFDRRLHETHITILPH